MSRLDRVFSAFDELAREHGLEKIKTIGDAYMAVAGAPAARADHATAAAAMAPRVRIVLRFMVSPLRVCVSNETRMEGFCRRRMPGRSLNCIGLSQGQGLRQTDTQNSSRLLQRQAM